MSPRPASVVALTLAFALALTLTLPRPAAADEPPLVHPIWSQLPDAPDPGLVRRQFTDAAALYHLGPVEVIDVPAPPPTRAPDRIKAGTAKALKIAFPEALRELDAAAAEVATTGGAGADTSQLFDLYLHRAMATAHADWNAPAATPPLGGGPDDPRARAFEDYLRAATLAPDRKLNARELPPQVVADFARAVEEVRRRARGTLVVKGSADGLLSLDGAPAIPVAGGVTFRDLVYGEHLVHVDEVGRAPWGTTLTLNAPSQELQIPERTSLALDDATAAAHAQRMGAKFALVGEQKPGTAARFELRLVDALGVRHDAALVAVGAEKGTLEATVMRLDEEARRIVKLGLAPTDASAAPPPALAPSAAPPVLIAPPPARTRFADDPAAWARDHWPLLTAAGVVLVTALTLSIVVENDR